MRPSHYCRSLLVLFVVCTIFGCGRSGPERFNVSGKVTFQGQPVPAGTISFLPDGGKGNKGPAGFAYIDNGYYDTSRRGKGTCGGAQIAVISGFSGKVVPGSEASNLGQQLFPAYRVNFELSPETTTKDFDVPASRRR
jgi:hypothetical protein